TGQGILMDIVLGIIGAVVGGYLFDMIGQTGITGFNIWSMLVAIVGAVLVLWIYHTVSGRSA
ncbi:MAG TPA: GlsB/YeaQ/YmgE family stress response membrane protein, partial [Methyloceanibacter sp.]|nr:GlsB/YeaQ/YmgE family stress response membrane protein [Methyloceanibacter sp.]